MRFIKTSKKHPFSALSAKFLTPEAKIEKHRTDSLKFRQFLDSHQISKLSVISSRILVSSKKAEGLVLNGRGFFDKKNAFF
jgi:hypothetical protein